MHAISAPCISTGQFSDSDPTRSRCPALYSYFTFQEGQKPEQINYLRLEDQLQKCSKCQTRKLSVFKTSLEDGNLICCLCLRKATKNERHWVKKHGRDAQIKIKKNRQIIEQLEAKTKDEHSERSKNILQILRNSKEGLKSLEIKGFAIDTAQKAKRVAELSIPIFKKIRKTNRQTSKEFSALEEKVNQTNEKKIGQAKNFPFEKMRKPQIEAEPALFQGQTFDWIALSYIFFKTRKDQLKKWQETLAGCVKTLESDIETLARTKRQFIIDFSKIGLDLPNFYKVAIKNQDYPFYLFAIFEFEKKEIFGNENLHLSKICNKLCLADFFSINTADLAYLQSLRNCLEQSNGRLNYFSFLQDFSSKNKEKAYQLLSRLEGLVDSALSEDLSVRQDERKIQSCANYLTFTKFSRKYEHIFDRYFKIKDDLNNYFSYISTAKNKNNTRNDIQINSPPIVPEIRAPFANELHKPPPSSGGISLQTLDFLKILDENISPYGFGGLINPKPDLPNLKLQKTPSFVPFHPPEKPEQVLLPSLSLQSSQRQEDKIMPTQADAMKSELALKEHGQGQGCSPEQTHDIESDCSVCFSSETSFSHPVIYCSDCGQGAHLSCIGLREIPSENYYCLSCRAKTEEKPPHCYICKKKGFMLLQLENDRSFAFHLFCVFATKSWAEIFEQQKQTKSKIKNKTRCQFCDKQNAKSSKMLKCANCKGNSFHALCGFLNGLYFSCSEAHQLSFEFFSNRQYDYNVSVFCEECTRKKLEGICEIVQKEQEEIDLVFMNGYFRLISIWPKFYKEVPSLEIYRKKRLEDCKFWTKI